MTTATHLTSLVGADAFNFTSSEKSAAITTAQAYLGTSDGDSNAKDMATAMLASNILLNRKKISTNPEAAVGLERLVTSEIRALMAEDEKSDAYKIIHYKKPTVDWR